jgi:valyl-tRNA synthetase
MPMEKTFDAATSEARIYAKWEAEGRFKAGANAREGAPSFSVMIPPPNVTGSLHMGHAFNNTLQDILVRWHRMQGHDTLWQPGQDHAGIATQMVVERKLAAEDQPTRAEMGREAFLEKVWEWKEESGGTIINQLKRLGASCDWDRNAFTMDANFQKAVLKVFVEMYAKGLIYRGKRLVNWDPHFETAISDLEVENIEIDGHMWHFKYTLADGETYEYVEKDEDGNVTLRETRDYISIATTRPETMLGDGAVAVHPSDTRYAPIVGKKVHLPLCDRLIPIITDEYPDPDFGSGAVKITGAHDFNDYGVAQRNNIPLYALMDTRGAMRAYEAEDNLVPEKYRGMDRFEAREAVIADITAQGLAVMVEDEAGDLIPYVEDKKIMQPFGDRSKVVIEPMLTDQWFVDTDQIVAPALEAVRSGETRILPESDRKVYFHWLENIEPWCISRQLWWGHQIPVWYGLNLGSDRDLNADGDLDEIELLGLLTDGGMLHPNDVMHCAEDFEGVIDAFRRDNEDIPNPLSAAAIIEVADKQEAMERLAASLAQYNVSQDPTVLVYPVWRDADVLDTWFSSGLWPIGTLGWPEQTDELARYFPTSTLITGSDILFFWVARMMMMQLAVVDQIPFDTVYLHQLVRDEKGKKMSKTTGNVIDPLEQIDEYGADALRFANARMAALGGVLKLSKDNVQGARNFGTKLWNASRFAEMNEVFEVRTEARPAPKATLNRWIIGEVAKVREEVDAALEAYRFNDAAGALYSFVWGKFCDWYVEFSKPLILDENPMRRETQETMGWVLDQCLILMHPIMPFITEELWETTAASRATPLIHAEWPVYTAADLVDPEADREMNWVIGLIEEIRSARAQMRVPAGLKIPLLRIEIDGPGKTAWENNEALIMRLARLDSVADAPVMPKGAITIAAEGATFGLPIADIIDLDEEKARLEKNIGKLMKELGGLRGRLNNPKFVASAPDEVVAESREKMAALEEEEAVLQAALARLAELG